jgi:hypothetical protein
MPNIAHRSPVSEPSPDGFDQAHAHALGYPADQEAQQQRNQQ